MAAAASALDEAFENADAAPRRERVGEARQALEAFDLLERATGGDDLLVPWRVLGRVRRARDELDRDLLELARADLLRAQDELQRWLSGREGS